MTLASKDIAPSLTLEQYEGRHTGPSNTSQAYIAFRMAVTYSRDAKNDRSAGSEELYEEIRLAEGGLR